MRRAGTVFPVIMVYAAAGASFGAEVTFSISARKTYVGVPITIQVEIKNAEDHEPPVVPEVDGADAHIDGPSTKSFTSIRFGRMEKSVTYTYSCHITPRRAGTLSVPGIRVKADGKWTESSPTTILVAESETGDLLYLEVVSDVDSVYVGEPIDVTLEVWLKPFTTGSVRLDETTMWRSCVDVRNSAWGPFAEVIQNRQVRARADTRRDERGRTQSYYVYLLKHRVWPERPGTFDVSGVSVVVQYPLAVRRNRFSVFSPEYRISDSRPVSAVVGDVGIEIIAPPRQGQPSVYRGAVGRYSMRVTAAPREVSVGDPITINMEIRGTGRLELLQPPPLASQESLTADFRVPEEELAGVIEKGVKKFSQSIRAKHDGVTAIPPIAFAYFDPRSESYVTIKSDPIHLQVRESTRMAVSQVVESGARPGMPTELTRLDSGLWANYDDISELMARQSVVPGWQAWAFATTMPLIYATCFMFGHYRERLRGDQAFARRRRARRTAMSAIAAAGSAGGTASAAEISGAVTRYVADRFNLPPGGVTSNDAVRQLRTRRVAEEVIERVYVLLSECENAQYAGTGQSSADDFITRARRCIHELERQKT